MIYNVSLHKQLSNIEISNAVSMNKLTKNAVMKHLLGYFCLIVSYWVNLFVYNCLVLLLWYGHFSSEAATNFLAYVIKS